LGQWLHAVVSRTPSDLFEDRWAKHHPVVLLQGWQLGQKLEPLGKFTSTPFKAWTLVAVPGLWTFAHGAVISRKSTKLGGDHFRTTPGE